jgi:APA family basic amino acid/polyamine antiporter
VPIGIIASLIICTILYIAVVAVLTGMVPYNRIDVDAGVSSAFREIGLDWAEVIIATAGVAGITSVLLVMMLSAPRVFMAMARDGLLPQRFFGDVHPTFRTPWKSTILVGLFVAVMTGLLPIGVLLELTNIGTLFAFVVVCAAVLVMRRTNPDAARPFRCPLVPVVPILGIALCLLPLPHEGPSTGEPAPEFQRKLGLFDSTMLVAGTMIGSGIFIVSADIARDVGSSGWLMAVWILTGIMTIIGALSYAELAAMMPHAGGQYVYLREAYSPLWGFLYGWTCFLVIQTGSIAAVGVAFAKFLGVLVPWLGTDQILYRVDIADIVLQLPWMSEPFFRRDEFTISAGQLVAVVVVVFLTLLNCRGVEEGKWVQNTFTIAKTLALVVLIVLGLTVAANPEAIAFNQRDWWSGIFTTPRFETVDQLVPLGGMIVALMVMGGAMVGSLFSADAWNNITFTAGEIRNPRRNLPLSLALGTGLVIVLYLLANLAYLAALPIQGDPTGATTFERGIAHAKDDRVGTAVLELAAPSLGVPFMAIAIMISTFGCVNGMTLMGARLYYAMAKDNLFFYSVGRLNRRGVPAMGLILQGVWSVLLVFSGTYNELLDYVIFAALFFYVLTVIGLFILRWKMPDAPRPYRAFGYPVIPALYVLLCAVIMINLLVVKPVYTWPGLIIVLAGIPVYFLWRLLPQPRAPVA